MKEIRQIKISVANIKLTDNKCEKGYAGSAVCLPKKPPNIAYISHEQHRHKSKKSVNQNININNTNQHYYKQDKPRDISRIRPPQIIRRPKPKKQIQQHCSMRQPYMLRTREKSISINLGYQTFHTLQTEGSAPMTKDLSSERFVSEEDDLMCEEEFNASRKNSFVKRQQNSQMRKNSISISTARPSLHDQIRHFDDRHDTFKMEFDFQLLHYLITRENQYNSLPFLNCYLDKKQQYINWTKRAVLVNWMMEVLTDYGGKRQILYLAVSMVDRYLCLSPNFPVNKLQLVGITSMLVAYKLQEQVRPRVSKFAEATGGLFTEDDIADFEQELLRKLKWYINPPNLNTWCNRITAQWDAYLSKDCPTLPQGMHDIIQFKSSDQKAYYNFRSLTQLLDFTLLDSHTLQYKSRVLVLSFMYVILCIRTQLYKVEDVLTLFPSTSKYLMDRNIWLNELFDEFLQFSFAIALKDLLPTIQYCATYFILPLSFELPAKARTGEQILVYEEFCSYQTINKANLLCLLKRNRTFD